MWGRRLSAVACAIGLAFGSAWMAHAADVDEATGQNHQEGIQGESDDERPSEPPDDGASGGGSSGGNQGRTSERDDCYLVVQTTDPYCVEDQRAR